MKMYLDNKEETDNKS